MIIMKFGGTSVANSEAINRVIDIVRHRLDSRPIIVVSALSKVTDTLYKIADAAYHSDAESARKLIDELCKRHLTLIEELLMPDDLSAEASAKVKGLCTALASFVEAVCTLGELTDRSRAVIISNGEMLSSTVIYYALNSRGISTAFADARTMIRTSGSNMKGEPIISEIEKLVPQTLNPLLEGKDAVITQGFISSTEKGEASVLGRGGSDYSASLIGMAMDATAIEIWTDVDGVKTADPRRVANTQSIRQISFEEAAEMAHFGAKVLHPLTIEPAVMKNIPVYVLNSLNPEDPGTKILQNDQIEEGVKSLSFKEGIRLVNIFSTKMINISGFLVKIFDIFAHNGVSVDLISTSEANISLTVDDARNLDKVVEELSEFAIVNVDNDKSQISIIGKNVVHQRGLIRWAMTALKQTNIYMITQAASSDNISFVIDRSDLDDVLQEFHNFLFDY